jgi:cytidylate kinase
MTVIAMTQEMATQGRDVAAGVAEALRLRLVRHELGDTVADRLNVNKSLIRRMRDGHAGWFEKREVDASTFAVYAAEQVFDLAREGDVLIRGWGAVYLLRDVRHVPCIRVCAPLTSRLKWLMERLQTDDEDLARDEIERSDSAHAARIRHNFGVAIGDPLLYDLVLNTGRVSVETCVELVLELVRRPEFQATEASLAQLGNLALAARIHSALRANPEATDIRVTPEVDGGAVTLRGTVMTEQEKRLVPKIVRSVAGVSSVSNRLRVLTGAKIFPSDVA